MPPSRPLLLLSRLAFVVLACIGVGASMLPNNGGLHVFAWDKADHFLCFYTLAVVGAFAFPRFKLVWLAAALSTLGAAIELVQALPIVARDCDWRDWVADTVAIACALGPLAIADWRARWGSDPQR